MVGYTTAYCVSVGRGYTQRSVVTRCREISLYVRLSVTLRYGVKTAKEVVEILPFKQCRKGRAFCFIDITKLSKNWSSSRERYGMY